MKNVFSRSLLNMYIYLPVAALLIGLYLVFTAEDVYRYECQDPQNWESPQCVPPLCLASGTCTSDLISIDGSLSNRYQEQIDQYSTTQEPSEAVVTEEAEPVVEEPTDIEPEIEIPSEVNEIFKELENQ